MEVKATLTAKNNLPSSVEVALADMIRLGQIHIQALNRLQDVFHAYTTSVEIDGKPRTVLPSDHFNDVFLHILKEFRFSDKVQAAAATDKRFLQIANAVCRYFKIIDIRSDYEVLAKRMFCFIAAQHGEEATPIDWVEVGKIVNYSDSHARTAARIIRNRVQQNDTITLDNLEGIKALLK